MLRKDGQTFGPFTLEEVRELLASNSITMTTEVAPNGTADWIALSQLLKQSGIPAPSSFPQSSYQPTPAQGVAETAAAQSYGLPGSPSISNVEVPDSFRTPLPPGVIVIGVLHCIAAFTCFLMILAAFFIQHLSGLLLKGVLPSDSMHLTGQSTFLSGIGAVLGIVGMIFCALYSFLAFGIFHLRNWARIATIVLAGLSILQMVKSFISVNNYRFNPQSTMVLLITFLISCWMIYYLNSQKCQRIFN